MKSITICPFCRYSTNINSRMHSHIKTKKHIKNKLTNLDKPELSDIELYEIINKKLM